MTAIKKKKDKKEFLITVRGFLPFCATPEEITSVVVQTDDPVKWFLSQPKVYSRGDFVPNALINFWEVKNEY